MSELLRFSGPTAPGFAVVLVALIVIGAAVLFVIELHAASTPRNRRR